MALLPTAGRNTLKKDTKFRQYSYNFFGRTLTLQGYEKFALEYMVSVLRIEPKDIITEGENDFQKTLNIRYKHGGVMRHYIPDFFVVSKRVVVEVKSIHTLGLLGNKKRGWTMTCAKARATREKGYNIILLLMRDDGTRIPMPKGWYSMKKQEVVDALGDELRARSSDALF